MKALCALLVALAALGLAACGSSNETTTVTEEAAPTESANVEALRLEKETAELEAEKARSEARKEAKAAKKAAEKAKTAAASSEPEPEPETAEVPNVVGMRLPEAQSTLRAAGFKAKAENTDTTFGIVIPSHYTVCEQSEPQGNVVSVLAQKYGC